MYVVPPPKRSDRLSGSTNASDALRVYQTWKGSNVSFSSFFFFLFDFVCLKFLLFCFDFVYGYG